MLLGQVDDVEVDAEGAYHLLQALCDGWCSVEKRLFVLEVIAIRAQGDGGGAQVLHRLQQTIAALLASTSPRFPRRRT